MGRNRKGVSNDCFFIFEWLCASKRRGAKHRQPDQGASINGLCLRHMITAADQLLFTTALKIILQWYLLIQGSSSALQQSMCCRVRLKIAAVSS